MDEDISLGRYGQIPAGDLTWSFTPSGGPGGQHANRASTRAEVRLDLRRCRGLTPSVRDRLIDVFGPTVVVVADETRSQSRNRRIAVDRLAARLRQAVQPRRRRRPTRPSGGANRRRLEAKRRHGEKKRQRRYRPEL